MSIVFTLLMFVDFLKSKAMILVYMFALNLVFFFCFHRCCHCWEKILHCGIIGTNQETETWRVVNLQELGLALEQVQ